MRRGAILLAALLLFAAPAVADRQAAQFFAGRGDKALQAKDWAGAEEQYRKSMDEDASFLPARYGLSQALFGKGDAAAATEELKGFVEALRADTAAPSEWKSLLAKAEKQLQDLDASGVALRKILDRWADELVLLARRTAPKDPVTARKAARRALDLRPGDRGAEDVLARLGDSAKGPPAELFAGGDASKFDRLEFPHWQVLGGNIVGDVRGGSRQIRSVELFGGEFDLKVEARVVEAREGSDFSLLALATYRGEWDYVGVGLMNRKVYFVERNSKDDRKVYMRKEIAEWKAPFDPSEWATYELRFRDAMITALINGTVVGEEARPEGRKDGFAGVLVQNGTVAFRRIEVQRR